MKSSIIIPAAGRPVAIKLTIESLLRLEPERHEAEIIVVDNNTAEELATDLRAYCATLEKRVRYVRETSPGLSTARHRGMAEAQSEQLTFIDEDVEVSSGWLAAIQKGFTDPNVAMIGGPSIPKFTGTVPAWFLDFFEPCSYGGWQCPWISLLDIGQDVPNVNPNLIWGLNISIRKTVLQACGGFHPDIGPPQLQRWQGDGESGLTMKVQAAGHRADYLQSALLLHFCGPERLEPAYFKRRAYYQGVCDSFTRIRKGQAPVLERPRKATPSVPQRIGRLPGRTWRGFRGRTATTSVWATQGEPIQAITEQAYWEGWLFHQREVAADPALLAWVRRENYLGADIAEEHRKREASRKN